MIVSMIASATLVGSAISGVIYLFYKYVSDDKTHDLVYMEKWIDEQEK